MSEQTDGEESTDRMSLLRDIALLLREHSKQEEALQDWIRTADFSAGSNQLGVERYAAFVELVEWLQSSRSILSPSIIFPPDYPNEYPVGSVTLTGLRVDQCFGPVPAEYFNRPIRTRNYRRRSAR